MKKLAIFGLVVLCAGMLMAAAVKHNLQPYVYASGAYEPNAYGQAILNYAKGADKTEIQVNCWGLTEGTTYWVWICGPSWIKVGEFTAKKNGTANFHTWWIGDKTAGIVQIDIGGTKAILETK